MPGEVSKNLPVEPSLLPDLTSWAIERPLGGCGHGFDLQLLNRDAAEAARDRGRHLMQARLAALGQLATEPGQMSLGLLPSTRPLLRPCQLALAATDLAGGLRSEPWIFDPVVGRQRCQALDAPADADQIAGLAADGVHVRNVDLQTERPAASYSGEHAAADRGAGRQSPVHVQLQSTRQALEDEGLLDQSDSAELSEPERAPAALAAEARETDLTGLGIGSLGIGCLGLGCLGLGSAQEGGKCIIEPVHCPTRQVYRNRPISLRVVAPHRRQRFALIHARDQFSAPLPGSDALFERGVVEQALAFQDLFERGVLHPRRPQAVSVGQKHQTLPTKRTYQEHKPWKEISQTETLFTEGKGAAEARHRSSRRVTRADVAA